MKSKTTIANSRNKRRALCIFMLHFALFTILTFLVIYLFFYSYDVQRKNIQKDIIAYQSILNKQYVLKLKMDSLFYLMGLWNTGKVTNDLALGKYITQNIQQTNQLIGADSISEFKHYALLLKQLDAMLMLKYEIFQISEKERMALRNLNECMGSIKKVKAEIEQDPTRRFQVK
ncbi:type VI secretion system TssO [Sphingobacterium sp. Mn56C]|uniref:type VI secretion system TssO n=1 Tax=Sphingobacterium sp. Mn56C TaxID=3395261 RepID=UPI003BC78EF7